MYLHNMDTYTGDPDHPINVKEIKAYYRMTVLV